MNDTRVDRKKHWIGCIVATLGCLLALTLVCCGGLYFLLLPPSPQTVFERETGLKWPPNATIHSSGDNHGGFLGDGEFHIVIDVDQSTIENILSSRPKAPLSDWQAGPVPTEIGFHCDFGTDGVSATTIDGGSTHYSGDPELVAVLSSSRISYSANERCCDSLRWHNGTLLVVDPANRRIWFSIWDF